LASEKGKSERFCRITFICEAISEVNVHSFVFVAIRNQTLIRGARDRRIAKDSSLPRSSRFSTASLRWLRLYRRRFRAAQLRRFKVQNGRARDKPHWAAWVCVVTYRALKRSSLRPPSNGRI